MGTVADRVTPVNMAKSSSRSTKDVKSIEIGDTQIQSMILVGILIILALAFWYGLKVGCLPAPRRRRRPSCW